MKKIKKIPERLLKPDKKFNPVSIDEGDEIFRNGIFHFNITKMLAFIHSHPDEVVLENVAVKDFPSTFSTINEKHLDSVQNSEPVILAEIAPGKFNLIDGNHRMEKARRTGMESVMAYRLDVEQHINFLTTQEAYFAYVEYWNRKIEDLQHRLELKNGGNCCYPG
ncbi:MAG: ParB/Srx family N-terminal domain-containing protein [Candidatus Wallbacteria bacterium]|nr:ParB/Srx family N-terminal domain-containing protein [Candidatus Wallbacteria bacterium]